MDSAGADPLKLAVTLLGQHASQQMTRSREVELLTAQLSDLSAKLQKLRREFSSCIKDTTASLSSFRQEFEHHANQPPHYDGNPDSC